MKEESKECYSKKKNREKWGQCLVEARNSINPEADGGVGFGRHCISAGVVL